MAEPSRRLRARPVEDSSPTASPSTMETPTPRLGLAFILNDARETRTPQLPVQRDRPSTRSEVLPSIASLELPLPLPPRRVDLWTTPQPLPVAGVASLRLRPLEETKDEETKPVKQEEGKVEEQRAADESHATPETPVPAPLSREEKRRGRTCRIDGCDNYIVHKGLCCRHGGARKCSTEGCDSTAKYMGLCWKHGGSTWCKVEGCSKRAKAKGRCWAHGGGTKCSHDGCAKVAVSNGLCWAHGGGKRCLFDGCNRPGYERTNGFCDRHHDEVQQVNYFEV